MKETAKFTENIQIESQVISMTDALGRIDTDRLLNEVTESEAMGIWYGILAAKAGRVCGEIELSRDIIKAQVEREVRERFNALDKKATERAIEVEVILDERYQAAVREALKARESMQILVNTERRLNNRSILLNGLTRPLNEEVRAGRIARPPIDMETKMQLDLYKAEQESGRVTRTPVE